MHDYTHISGHDAIRDPGLLRLRHYLPVLAVIGAPYAGAGGADPANPLDPVAEWDALAGSLAALPGGDSGCAPLALARLLPPTVAHLGAVLAHDGSDAFRVVHMLAHGGGDVITLENEHGAEHVIGAEGFARLFEDSGARVVVLDGCFSDLIADTLIARTPVIAVTGTRRRLPAEYAAVFDAHFYADLSAGADVRDAFDHAVAALEDAGGGAGRYDLVTNRRAESLAVPLPDQCADRALLLDGQPPRAGIPETPPAPAGFVGRREALAALAAALPDAGKPVVLYGPAGMGKTWLAAHAAARLGWRFPDGVAWLRCTAATTRADLGVLLAELIGQPPQTPFDALLDYLHGRRVLLVLDAVDAIPEAAQAAVGEAARAICAQNGSRVLATSTGVSGWDAVRDVFVQVGRFAYKSARTLALRLAVERGLDALDVDTIDDFLDTVQGVPWLVAAGVGWIEEQGLDAALDRLAVFPADYDDPLGAHAAARVRDLARDSADALRLLRRVVMLPASFDRRIARGLGGDGADDLIAELRARGLLVDDAPDDESGLLDVPPVVRAFVLAQVTLSAAQAARVDRACMAYYTRAGSRRVPPPGGLTRADWAWLHNVRALLRRALDAGGDSQVAAQLIAVAAPLFAAAGLVAECARAAEVVAERLPDDLAADWVQMRGIMAHCLASQPESRAAALAEFERLYVLPGLDPALEAEITAYYAAVLLVADEVERAAALYAGAFALLRDVPQPDVLLAADVFAGWARALADLGRDGDAIPRYRDLLTAYARMERPDRAARALYQLAGLLARNVEHTPDALDRADNLLRRALASAEQVGDHGLAARVRYDLARMHVRRVDALESSADDERLSDAIRADLDAAAALLLAARLDALGAAADPGLLAALLVESADVDGRRRAFEDAARDAQRGADAYERAGDRAGRAQALAQTGRLAMARGDSVTAQAALHEALTLAGRLDLRDLQAAAAGLLVRVHHLRAWHAMRSRPDFIGYTRAHAEKSRALLDQLGLIEHVAALDRVIATLQGGDA